MAIALIVSVISLLVSLIALRSINRKTDTLRELECGLRDYRDARIRFINGRTHFEHHPMD